MGDKSVMIHRHFRSLPICLALSLATLASATIEYRVKPLPDSRQVAVTIAFATDKPETVVQIPRWMPGYYVLNGSNKNIKDFAVVDNERKARTVTVVDDSTWRIESKGARTLTLNYKAPFNFADGMGHYKGTPTYIYVQGRTQEPCRLQIDAPADWKVAVGLNELRTPGALGQHYYSASTYDVLADNGVTLGDFVEREYTVAGKVHTIAAYGPSARKADMNELQKQCQIVSQITTDFMGGAPYDKYVWHFNLAESRGGGGMEHLSSTEIDMTANIGKGTAGFLCHEFFHLWNVKRIRSRVLGPFDYTQLPKTGALWWLEGTTDYYAYVLLARNGYLDEKEWLCNIAGNVASQRSMAGRLKISPYDSSYRVGEASNGIGNSNGFEVSYYNDGFIAGLCLDLELIARTDGKKSLDDVELALWKLCRDNRPGFEEGEIRKQLVIAGGPWFGDYYDRIIMKPGEFPVEEALAQVGLELVGKEIKSIASPSEKQLTYRKLWMAKHR